jgi:hypothetical protein
MRNKFKFFFPTTTTTSTVNNALFLFPPFFFLSSERAHSRQTVTTTLFPFLLFLLRLPFSNSSNERLRFQNKPETTGSRLHETLVRPTRRYKAYSSLFLETIIIDDDDTTVFVDRSPPHSDGVFVFIALVSHVQLYTHAQRQHSFTRDSRGVETRPSST